MLRSMSVVCPANAAEEQALRKLCAEAAFGPVGDLKAVAACAGASSTAAAPSALTDAILACCSAGRFVWVTASTHAGEEAAAATAHARLCAEGKPLAIIAPRHPARAATVVAELAQQHPLLRFALLSRDGAHAVEHSDVYVVDAFGLLPELYAAASVAFVGNSLAPGGKGHNLAEAAAGHCVVLAGPYLGPFASIAEHLCAANAMSIVANATELYAALLELHNAPEDCARRGAAAAAASAGLAAGVLQRVFDAVNAALALDTC
jgi:3-deoxy-D-manno-octulosonic-acid transferase